MTFVRGLSLAALLAAGLFLLAPGLGRADNGTVFVAAKAKDLIIGKWKSEKDKTIITLDFDARQVKFKNEFKSDMETSTNSGQGTYEVVDEKTLELPKLGKAFDEKVTIVSITKDKMVLNGGETWKFNKTEFTRQK